MARAAEQVLTLAPSLPEPLSTVGVDLGIWKYRKDLEPECQKSRKKGAKQLRSVTFYTWDFGGQVSPDLQGSKVTLYPINKAPDCMGLFG